jgi:hypothetical protein
LAAWHKWNTQLPENEGDQPIPAADMFQVIKSSKDSNFDIDYLGESTKGDMNVRPEAFEYGDSHLQEVAASLDESLEEIAKTEAKEAEALLDGLKIPVIILVISGHSTESRAFVTYHSDCVEAFRNSRIEWNTLVLLRLTLVTPPCIVRVISDVWIVTFEDLCVVPQRRFPHGVASRGIFCSRTLSLRSITTIGYDMDYTLIHYNVHVRNSFGTLSLLVTKSS